MTYYNMMLELVQVCCDLGMIIGPCTGYIVQIVKMYQEKNNQGFSTYVSFILILSNLIRIFWWYIEQFSFIIFQASVLMIVFQMILLYIWVYINQLSKSPQIEQKQNNISQQETKNKKEHLLETKMIGFQDKNENKQVDLVNDNKIEIKEEFVESFWYWNSFFTYVMTMSIMISSLITLTYFFQESPLYVGTLGTLSSLIEAVLGIPQFYLNWQRQNTEGLAPVLIFMWLFGDLYKISYYYNCNSPLQLILCSIFQICVDCAILSQFQIYKHTNTLQTKTCQSDYEAEDSQDYAPMAINNELKDVDQCNKKISNVSTATEEV